MRWGEYGGHQTVFEHFCRFLDDEIALTHSAPGKLSLWAKRRSHGGPAPPFIAKYSYSYNCYDRTRKLRYSTMQKKHWFCGQNAHEIKRIVNEIDSLVHGSGDQKKIAIWEPCSFFIRAGRGTGKQFDHGVKRYLAKTYGWSDKTAGKKWNGFLGWIRQQVKRIGIYTGRLY